MTPASSMHARWIVRHFAKRHVADTPAGESGRDWIARANVTRDVLSDALKAAVNPADLYELLVDFEEFESIECGTHPDIVRNEQQTVDNTLDITERITSQISQSITAVLDNAEPMDHTERISA